MPFDAEGRPPASAHQRASAATGHDIFRALRKWRPRRGRDRLQANAAASRTTGVHAGRVPSRMDRSSQYFATGSTNAGAAPPAIASAGRLQFVQSRTRSCSWRALATRESINVPQTSPFLPRSGSGCRVTLPRATVVPETTTAWRPSTNIRPFRKGNQCDPRIHAGYNDRQANPAERRNLSRTQQGRLTPVDRGLQ
jgi:hypothetical protein